VGDLPAARIMRGLDCEWWALYTSGPHNLDVSGRGGGSAGGRSIKLQVGANG